MKQKIDFVIPWVDGDDEKWLEKRSQYTSNQSDDAGEYRYRNLVDLRYVFRGIEQHASWVNKVHFITEGHLPDFLDINHPKLNIVEHRDYIPKEYLPTFSSHPIELNLHRIEGLSEQFVYLNDDILFVDDTVEEDFFINNLPCDQATIDYITSDKGTIFPHILLNNVDVLNRNFNKKEVVKGNFDKWYTTKYTLKENLKNLYYFPLANFSGLKWYHNPSSFLKSTFEELWAKEFELLNMTSKNRFRNIHDVNQYLFKNWQIANGNFYPVSLSKSAMFYNMPDLEEQFVDDLEKNRYKVICINDSAEIDNFNSLKKRINNILKNKFPDKSSFEKSSEED